MASTITPERETGPLLYTVKQAGQALGLTPYSTKELIDSGALPSVRIGSKIYVPAVAVRQWVEDIASRSA